MNPRFLAAKTLCAVRRRILTGSVLLVALLAGVPCVDAAKGIPAPAIVRIETEIKTTMTREKIPGLSIAIVSGDQSAWTNGYGWADVENMVPATSATVYRLASVSKPITAVAVMQLVEQHKVDLDAPIQEYCPAFPEKQWPVTARLLLAHLAGVRHYSAQEYADERHYDNVVDGLSIFSRDPLLAKPGTKFLYSSYGYNLLGCAVEGASKMDFVHYVTENVFEPANMKTARVDDSVAIIPNRARGYSKMTGGNLGNALPENTSYKIPSAGLCSTVADLIRFVIALQDHKLLTQETLQQMWTAQRTQSGQETDYGLGWEFPKDRDVQKVVYHRGDQRGVSTVLYMIPDRHISVIIMTNLEGAKPLDLAIRVANILAQQGGDARVMTQ